MTPHFSSNANLKPRDSSLDGLIGVAVFIIVLVATPLLLGFVTLMKNIHAARCGQNAYVIAGWHPMPPTLVLVTFTASIGFAGVLSMISAMTNGSDVDLKRWRNRTALIALVSAPLLIYGVPALLFDQYCVSDGGVSIQPSPWGKMRHYGWDQARGLYVSCTQVKGGWSQTANIVFEDGVSARIPPDNNYGAWFSVYERVLTRLHGYPVVLYASAVNPSCPMAEHAMLLKTP